MLNSVKYISILTIKTDKRGATAILLTLLIMFSIIGVTLAASSIVQIGLKLARNQTDSTKAYFAAEAGAERILWDIRNNAYDYSVCPLPSSKFCFSSVNPNNTIANCLVGCSPYSGTNFATTTLSNGSMYYINYYFVSPDTTISSFGEYGDTRRKIELKY